MMVPMKTVMMRMIPMTMMMMMMMMMKGLMLASLWSAWQLLFHQKFHVGKEGAAENHHQGGEIMIIEAESYHHDHAQEMKNKRNYDHDRKTMISLGKLYYISITRLQ